MRQHSLGRAESRFRSQIEFWLQTDLLGHIWQMVFGARIFLEFWGSPGAWGTIREDLRVLSASPPQTRTWRPKLERGVRKSRALLEAESLNLKLKPQIENQRKKSRAEAASQERKSEPKAETETLTQPLSPNGKFRKKP